MPKKPKYTLNDEGKRIYSCQICQKPYPYRTSLKRHIQKCHENLTSNNEDSKNNKEVEIPKNSIPSEEIKIQEQVIPQIEKQPLQNANLQEVCEIVLSLRNELRKFCEKTQNSLETILKQSLHVEISPIITPEKQTFGSPSVSSSEVFCNKAQLEKTNFNKTYTLGYQSPKSNYAKLLQFGNDFALQKSPYDIVPKERHVYIPRVEKIVKCENLRLQIVAFLAEHGEKPATVSRYYKALSDFSKSLSEGKTPDYEDWLKYIELHKTSYILRTPEISRNQDAFENSLKIVSTFLKKYFGFSKLTWPAPFPPRRHPYIPDPIVTKEILLKLEKYSPLLYVALYVMYLTGIRPVALMNLRWNQITTSSTGPIINISYTGKYDKGSFSKPIPESAYNSFMKIKQDLKLLDTVKIWPKSRSQLNLEMRSFTIKSNTFAIKCSSMRKAHANTIMQSGIAEVCRDALKHQNAATTMASYIPDDWRKLFTLNSEGCQENSSIIEDPITTSKFRNLSENERNARKNVHENAMELERKTYEFIKKNEKKMNNSKVFTDIRRFKRRNDKFVNLAKQFGGSSRFSTFKRKSRFCRKLAFD